MQQIAARKSHPSLKKSDNGANTKSDNGADAKAKNRQELICLSWTEQASNRRYDIDEMSWAEQASKRRYDLFQWAELNRHHIVGMI